jgi:hypothetical protein
LRRLRSPPGEYLLGRHRLGIGIAWDWIEALDGVFAMADPMAVISNIGFVDQSGASIPEFVAAVHLNRITHELPWQAEVANATRGVRVAEPWSRRVRASRSRTRASDDFPLRFRATSDSAFQRL